MGGAYFRDEIRVKKGVGLLLRVYFCNRNQKDQDYFIVIIVVFSQNFSQIVIRLAKFSFSSIYCTNNTETPVCVEIRK